MTVNYQDYAAKLRITDVWKAGNDTGRVTPRVLYDPALGKVYQWRGAKGLLMHGTAGTNTLPYFTGGSVADGRFVCAHYLLPKDDYTVYKMVPDGFSCNHAGDSEWHGISQPLNSYLYGIECENLQNWQEAITPAQHLKAALIWCYLSARDHLIDLNCLSHSQVALPLGRREDPEAGLFDWALFWGHVWDIRKAANWPTVWALPRWGGGRYLVD